METNVCYIGVDVAKSKLDVYAPANGDKVKAESVTVPNTTKGFSKIRALAKRRNAVVCVEPTGGYELAMLLSLQKDNVAVAYADALRVRRYAQSKGVLAKNDRIDARQISEFAVAIGVRVLEPKRKLQLELQRLERLRQQYIEDRTRLLTQLEREIDAGLRKLLRSSVKHCDKQIAIIEKKSLELVRSDPELASLCDRMTAVDGLKDKTVLAVLAGLPELGELPDKKLFKLVGIAPMQRQSGEREWTRHIWGGRKPVRNALFMAGIASLQWNPIIHAYYEKKVNDGMPHFKAMVPVMRKLLSLLNRIARDQDFKPKTDDEFHSRMVARLKGAHSKHRRNTADEDVLNVPIG